MIDLPRDEQLAIVAAVGRAPSAHNTQPARWRFSKDRVTLFEDPERRLPVADPHNRDGRISLGAALEGMVLALSSRGYCLQLRQRAATERQPASEGELLKVADGQIVPFSEPPDPLAHWVPRRRTWRGNFAEVTDEERNRLEKQLTSSDDIVAVTEPAGLAAVARLHDRCIWSFLRHRDYHRELYEWLRFSPRHRAWSRDGLTTDCMDLSWFERGLMQWVFHPTTFRGLKALGLGPSLASEAGAVRSATAVAVLHAPEGQDPLVSGRRLYRFWLEVSSLGLAACPMSATADSAEGREALRQQGLLPPGREPINLFRIGPVRTEIPTSRRLPAEELLV